MSYIGIIYENKAVHVIASVLGLNRIRRGKNKISGLFNPLCVKSSICLYGKNNTVSLGTGAIYKSAIFIEGENNRIIIGNNLHLRNVQIWIKGNDCVIQLGNDFRINNAELGAENSGSRLICGDDTQIGGFAWLKNRPNRTRSVSIYTGEGSLVQIGESVRIAENSVIKNYDSHVIYSTETNKRLNSSKDIVIGDNIWICPGSLILKGSGVGNGSIVGSKSILTKDFSDSNNVLLVGSPAKIVKENVSWRL